MDPNNIFNVESYRVSLDDPYDEQFEHNMSQMPPLSPEMTQERHHHNDRLEGTGENEKQLMNLMPNFVMRFGG
ncbi:hypothetical protein HanHA300_Chr01g0014731 [Helianthus annuus]|nr:hypothetical protein HanHA300_Chr01g0014731 [Helianthus annuus]KAJ0626666.1 hypothetical protein HanHA89_Chr01g0016361 [Helianthus annuus]KAJ0783012.1 hypothetical protein HanLR1_Chr01g0015281 [Helianthus annuus]